MKKILSLPFWLLLVLFCKAQTFDVAISDEMKGKIPQRQVLPLGHGFLGLQIELDQSPFVYSLHRKKVVKYGITLSKWTSSMIRKKEGALFNGERSCGPFLPELLRFYGQPWLLYCQFLSDDEDSKLQIRNTTSTGVDRLHSTNRPPASFWRRSRPIIVPTPSLDMKLTCSRLRITLLG